MKSYKQLTQVEQAKAIDTALNELVDCLANGLITFGKKLQVKIDFAINRALRDNMQWSTQEYILEVAKDDLMVFAKGIAEDAQYKPNGEFLKKNLYKGNFKDA